MSWRCLSCSSRSPSRLSGETPPKPLAPELYDQAVQLRTALEGKPKRLRTSSDYQRVINKYRSMYHQFPGSSRADDALLAVAELYQLMGSDLKNARNFQQAIQAYVFLEREYPASPYGAEGLFTAAEIYLNDLNDAAFSPGDFQGSSEAIPSFEEGSQRPGPARRSSNPTEAGEEVQPVRRQSLRTQTLPRRDFEPAS